ncbi:hypothetical protein LCGC14_2848290, partial [marine sediment metagenome]
AWCYIDLAHYTGPVGDPPTRWPWDAKLWKPSKGGDWIDDEIRNLEKGGALTAAEIDRLLALKNLR